MLRFDERAFQVYAFGLTSVLAATTLRLLFQMIFGNTTPYTFYILPVIATAAYGGLVPGLFATISSALVLAIAFLGRQELSPRDALYFFLFLVDSLFISWLGERMSLTLRAAARTNSETEDFPEPERPRILRSDEQQLRANLNQIVRTFRTQFDRVWIDTVVRQVAHQRRYSALIPEQIEESIAEAMSTLDPPGQNCRNRFSEIAGD
jgi:K+-sensing histidine kinase KdpD